MAELFLERPHRRGIPLQEVLHGQFWTEVQKATALLGTQLQREEIQKVEGVTLEPGV